MKKVFLTMFSVLFALFAVVGIGGINASAETNYLEMSVTLTEDITINFKVVNAQDYATAKMHFAYLDGKKKTEEVKLANGEGKIKFSELPAQYMAEEVTVTLTLVKADGTESKNVQTETVSVSSYARKVLNEATDSAQDKALKKLVIDMLYYGDAAQSYLEGTVADSEKATAVLTDTEKKAYALAEKAEKSDYALENNTSENMRWVRYGAKFDSRLGVFFEFVAKNEENLSVKFNDGTTVTTFETRTQTVNGVDTTVYKAIKYLSVLDYTSPVTATLYSGESVIGSPITYSVNSLTYDFEEAETDYALAIAATTYASSAVDYKNGVGYYYFEAEDERTALSNSASAPEIAGKLSRNSTYVGNLSGNTGAAIEYFVKADKVTTATLYVAVTKADGKKFTDTMTVKINDAEVTFDAVVPAKPDGANYYASYATVELGNIELAEGDNVISFIVQGWSTQYNFDKIILKCADSLEWGNDSHECSEVCSFCGGCMDEYCDRYACRTKCTCEELKIEAEDYTAINNPLPADGSKGVFGTASGYGASSGKYIGGVGNIMAFKSDCDGDAYLEYTIYSDEDAEVSFSFGAGVGSTTRKSAFEVKVTYADDTSGDFTATEGTFEKGDSGDLDPIYYWQKQNYGKIKLKKGKNVIRVTVVYWASMNLDYFTFRTQSGANLRRTAEQA